MPANLELPAATLLRSCSPADIPFETTAQARGFEGVIGQDRAVDALRFGIDIGRPGFNLFAIGPPGVGKQTLLRQLLDAQAGGKQAPADWCYVHDFERPERPRVLELPAGAGLRLQQGMAQAVVELRLAMRSAFESEEYRSRKHQLVHRFKDGKKRRSTRSSNRQSLATWR